MGRPIICIHLIELFSTAGLPQVSDVTFHLSGHYHANSNDKAQASEASNSFCTK